MPLLDYKRGKCILIYISVKALFIVVFMVLFFVAMEKYQKFQKEQKLFHSIKNN